MPSPPRLAFIDFEASSPHPTSYPVEVGVAEPRRDDAGWIIAVRGWLIRPADEWLARPEGWSAASERIHGLARRAGLSDDDLMRLLATAPPHVHTAGADSYRDAWIWAALKDPGSPAPRLDATSTFRRR
jgi:hypothetical protein